MRDERGAVALVVALLTVVIAGLAAIVVDLGYARDQHRTAQNAADAGALAAADVLADARNPLAVTPADVASARTAADQYVRSNGWDAGIGTFDVDPVSGTVRLALVPVRAPQMFAGVLGSSTPNVGAAAAATWAGATPGCSLCILHDFNTQNGQVLAASGSVLVGGSLTVGPNGAVRSTSGIVGVAGAVTANGTVLPPASAIPAVTDPYAVTPVLPPVPLGARVSSPAGPACTPGTYLAVTACRTFATGVYVITGTNRFAGNATIDASSGVLFYVTCSRGFRGRQVSAACAPGQTGGSLDFAGTVGGTITALPDPAYRGLAVVYDRNNKAGLAIVGGPGMVVNGGVYAAAATLTNSGTGPLTVDGTLVVGAVDMHGVPSSITINGADAVPARRGMLVHLNG